MIVIPFAGDCPYRLRALDWVRSRYLDAGCEVVVGEGDPDHWSKADAVADALTRTDAPTLVVADADVWTEHLPEAIMAVESGAVWATPHGQVWRLTKHATVRYLAGDRSVPETEETHRPMVGGGIVVLDRSTYDDCPLDPRFVGWGAEDQAWGFALTTLHGPPVRADGRLLHFWHPPQARRSRIRGSVESQQLLGRYEQARGHLDLTQTLIEEGRAWRSKISSRLPSPS